MLDTSKIIETPEGVELKLTVAGFYVRSIAWFIDLCLQGVALAVFAIVLPGLGSFGTGLFLLTLFVINWFYPVFFEIYNNGQTPGKQLMKIQAIAIDGTPINWSSSLLRNLLRTVDFLPYFYVLGVITMILNKDFRRLGDLAANTMVVYLSEHKNRTIIPEAKPHVPGIMLTAAEQQAILNYAERLNNLSPERAEELARMAMPLMRDLERMARPGTGRLIATANHLLGRR